MNRHRMQLSYSDVNDYFIISSNQQFHTTLSQSALNQSHGRKLLTCTCEAALFLNDKEKIKEICNFRFLFKKNQATHTRTTTIKNFDLSNLKFHVNVGVMIKL